MKFTQLRNATAFIEYAGITFLIDPYLSPKGTYEGFAGSVHSEHRNPTVDLPLTIDEIIKKTDCAIVTHTHLDHWDDAAVKHLPKNLKIFVQDGSNAPMYPSQPEQEPANNAALLTHQGFTNLEILSHSVRHEGITITPITTGQHGDSTAYSEPEMAAILGDAMGVILQSPSEPTIYLIGDTIWTKGVAQTLEKYQPEIIIVNAGCAQMLDPEHNGHDIIMGAEDFRRIHKFAPHSLMIATHMEAVNHATLTRKALREFIKHQHLTPYVAIPEDGETIDPKEYVLQSR